MAGRRRVLTASSSPRYKAKMYDYISKGGRIPATLSLQVVEAMDSERTTRWGEYHNFRKTTLAPLFDKHGIPPILRGIVGAVAYHLKAYFSTHENLTIDDKSKIIESIATEYGIAKIPGVLDFLKEAFGITVTVTPGTSETEQTSPKRP